MSKEPTRRDDKDEKTPMQVDPGRGRRPDDQTDDERQERERQQREDPLYLEKTRPEDPSGRPGQTTRDNVNPNIPSGKPGDPPNSGGIVDPRSLGMEQGGGVPPPETRTEPAPEGTPVSINEPPGSDVAPDVPPPEPEVDLEAADKRDLSDPDEMEEELDEENGDDDDKPTRRVSTTKTLKKKK